MPEAEIAGQAEEDVEADGEDAEDHEALQQVRVAGVELRHAAVGEGNGFMMKGASSVPAR